MAVLDKIKAMLNGVKKIEIQNLAKVFEINKWETEVDQDTFELDTVITYTYDEQTYNLSDGQYELEDGKIIHVDIDGKIVLIEGETTEEVVEEETTEEVVEEDTDLSKDSKTELELANEKIDALGEQLVTLAEAVASLLENDSTDAEVVADTTDEPVVDVTEEDSKNELELANEKIVELQEALDSKTTTDPNFGKTDLAKTNTKSSLYEQGLEIEKRKNNL